MDTNIIILTKEIALLREENANLKEQLAKYKNMHKPYYEKNKEIVNEKAKLRLKKLSQENPEVLKEINHKAYLKRKEKLKNIALQNKIEENI
jgi:hypothetical protein